jgi:hypothetical protein
MVPLLREGATGRAGSAAPLAPLLLRRRLPPLTPAPPRAGQGREGGRRSPAREGKEGGARRPSAKQAQGEMGKRDRWIRHRERWGRETGGRRKGLVCSVLPLDVSNNYYLVPRTSIFFHSNP